MSFPNPATIALGLTSFIVGAAGFFKAIGGQPAKELKKLGYPMLFLQALGAAEAALGVLSYFDPVTASLGIVLCMGGATQNNLILENNPGKTVFTVVRSSRHFARFMSFFLSLHVPRSSLRSAGRAPTSSAIPPC